MARFVLEARALVRGCAGEPLLRRVLPVFMGMLGFVDHLAAQQTPPLLAAGVIKMTAAAERSQLDRTRGLLTSTVEVKVRNDSTHRIDGPLHAVLRFKDAEGEFITSGIAVPGTEGGFGLAPWQTPFFDLTSQVPASGLLPGNEVAFTLVFTRNRSLTVTYEFEFAGLLNRDPIVDPGGPYSGSVGDLISFTATATDPDGHPLSFGWDFGDGTSATTADTEHAFATPGVHHLLLTVADDHGAVVERDVAVTVVPAGDFALARTRAVDGNGHPLGGTSVEESGPGGTRTLATEDSGFISLGTVPGEYLWKFSAPGHLPVWRRATLGARVVRTLPSPWLADESRSDTPVSVLAENLIASADGSVRLTFPPGALDQAGEARVTVLGPQTLPIPLPFGWSPLAAFHLALPGPPSAPGQARLQLGEAATTGEFVNVLEFDVDSLRWKVIAVVPGDGTAQLAAEVPRAGTFAAVVRDEGTGAPLPVGVGEFLPAGTAQNLAALVAATGTVDPAENTASPDGSKVTARGTVNFTAGATLQKFQQRREGTRGGGDPPASTLPSGSWFRLAVQETYSLSDGSALRTPDYDATFYAYRRPAPNAGAHLRADFPLRPRLLFAAAELKEARLHAEVLPPLGTDAGALSPVGGLLEDEDLQVEIPAGALGGFTAGELRALNPAGFSGLVGADQTVIRAFELNLSGLEPDALLAFALSGPVDPNADFVLARLIRFASSSGLEPVQRLHSNAAGVLANAEPNIAPKLPGLTGAGQFLLVKLAAPQGLVSGLTRAGSLAGAPLANIGVRSSGQPWLKVSGGDGSFSLLLPAGLGSLVASHSANGDGGFAAVTMPPALTSISQDVAITAIGPHVASTTPAAGATKIPVVTPITVTFSERIAPSSFGTDGLTLRAAGASSDVVASLTLDLANRVATLLPSNPLAADTTYTLTASAAIRDLQNLALEGSREFAFTTAAPAARGEGAQLTIFEPDAINLPAGLVIPGYNPADKLSRVVAVGNAGTADPEATVLLVNETTGETATVLSKPDGSFANFISAAEEDFVSAVFINSNGTRIEVPATRQLFDDGRVGLYKAGGILEAQSDGGPVQVIVKPEAIKERSVFKMEAVSLAQILEAANGVLPKDTRLLQGFRIQAEKEIPTEGIDVSFPVDPATFQFPPGEQPENAALGLLVPTEVEGVTAYELVDKMRYENGRAFSNSPPFLGIAGSLLFQTGFAFQVTLGLFGGKPVVVSGNAYEAVVPLDQIASTLGVPTTILESFLTGGLIGNLPGVGGLSEQFLQNRLYFRPVGGAFVFSAPAGTTNSPPGRIEAGAVYTTTGRDGLYALALPILVGEAAVPFSRAPGYRLVAVHPRHRQKVVLPLSLSEIGVDLLEAPVFSRNLVFTGPLANGSTTPAIRVEAALQPSAPAVNQAAALRAIAFARTGGPTLVATVETAVPTVAGETVQSSDVHVDNIQTRVTGIGTTELTAIVTCAKSAQALIRVTGTVVTSTGTLVDSALVLVRFGEGEPPLPDVLKPADLTDNIGPGVLRANLADGASLPVGTRIVLQFSEPVTRLSVKRTDAIVFDPAPLTLPSTFLSADQKTLEIYPGQFAESAGTVKLTITNVIQDLAGNRFDQVAGLPGEQTYVLNFRPAVARTLQLTGLENGGGVVSYNGFIYALERSAANNGVRILRTDTVFSGATESAGFIPLIGTPRDLVLIKGWAHKRSLHDPELRTADLLVVVGGDAGSQEVDENFDVFFEGQFLRVFDLTNPAAPERIVGALLTLRPTLVTRVAWSPPHLAYLESGSEIQQIGLINLQSMLIGFNGTPAEQQTFGEVAFDGLDLDQNGSFAQSAEKMPTPQRNPPEFYGKDAGFVLNEPGLIQDVAVERGFVGVVTTGGKDPLRPFVVPTLPAYRTLRANHESLPETAGILFFEGGARPKRLTVLLDQIVSINGQQQRRSLALVSMAPDHGGKNQIVMVDLTNPAVPSRLPDTIEIPAAFGLPQSIVKREDGLLALSTTTHLMMLDPARLFESGPGGAGTAGQMLVLHPAVVSVIANAGSGNRTADSDPTGVNLVNLGGRHELVQTAPRLSFVIFPTLPTTGPLPNPQALMNNFTALDSLTAGMRTLSGIPLARLTTKGGAASSIEPPSPVTHSFVLVECPGGAGAQLNIALESLNAGGYALKDKGKDFPPVRAVSPATLGALGQSPSSRGGSDTQTGAGDFRSAVPQLTAYRLSDKPESRYYNLYLSDPFALIRERATRQKLADLTQTPKRPILWSAHSLRASLDNTNQSNITIGLFADRIDSVNKQIDPAAFVVAETLSGSYLPGDNPPPPGAEVSFPGTFNLVNALNGGMQRVQVDLTLPSRRMPIVFQRTLVGQDLNDGPFGPGWDFNYNQHLVEFKAALFPAGSKAPIVVRNPPELSSITESRDVQLIDGEGHVILFKNRGQTAPPGIVNDPLAEKLGWFTAGGEFFVPDVNTKNVFDILYRFPSKEFCRLTPNGTQFWYAEDGRLLKINNRHKGVGDQRNQHVLDYERGELVRITDKSVTTDRFLEIGRYRLPGDMHSGLDQETDSAFVAGQICVLRDYAGRETNFEYAATGVLITVLYPDTNSQASSSAGLVGFKGRPTTRYLMKAPAQGGFQGVTEGNGANTAGGGGNAGTPLFSAQLDTSSGKPVATSGTGAAGSVTTAVNPANSAETGPDPAGNTGERADQSKAKFAFDGHGQPIEVNQTGPNAGAATTGITYAQEPELGGLVKTVTGPEGDTVTYEYFNGSLIRSKPNLRRITRTPGQRGGGTISTSFTSYDPLYNLPVGASTNYSGKTVTSSLTSDKTEIEDIAYAGGGEHHWTYNEFGQRLTESTPEGITRAWSPRTDDGFIESEKLGSVTTTFGYDSTLGGQLGQPTSVVLPRGQAVNLTYDARLLLMSRTRGTQETLHAYDENGNAVLESATVDGSVRREEIRTFNQNSFMTTSTFKNIEKNVSDTEDLITTYAPDSVARVQQVTLPGGETQVLAYDHLGRVIKITTGTTPAHLQEFTYDLNGNQRTVKLSNGGFIGGLLGDVVQEVVYDGHDRPITIKRGGSGGEDLTTMTYFGGGELRTRKITGPAGGDVEDLTVSDVDAYGRPTQIIRRGSLATATTGYTYTVDATGLTVVQTGPRSGYSLTRKTDAAGRLSRLNDSLAQRTFTVNDGFMTEQVSSAEDGTTYVSNFEYDDLDRLKKVSDGLPDQSGLITSYTPRLDGLPTEATDALGQTTSLKYSKLGELLRMDRLESLRMDRGYDRNRRLTFVHDREDKGHGYEYSDNRLRMNRQTLRNDAEIKFNNPIGFNAPTSVALPGGEFTDIAYDGQGRIEETTIRFNGTTFKLPEIKYDAAGRVQSVEYETHGTTSSATYTYDTLGPLKQADFTEEGGPYSIKHGLREDGARTTITYPSGQLVTEDRENNGRLTRISVSGEAQPIWEATGPNAFAGIRQPKTITRGPLTETRTYDLRRRLTSIKVVRTSDGAVLSDWRFVWDAANNLIARQAVHEQGRADLFSYDEANRLEGAHLGARPASPGESATPIGGLAPGQGLKAGYAARTFTYDTGGLDLLIASSTVSDTGPSPIPLAPFPRDITGHDTFLNPHTIDAFDRGNPDTLGNTAKIRHGMLDGNGQFSILTATLLHNGRGDLVKATRSDNLEILYHYRPDHVMHRKVTKTSGGTTVGDRALVWDGMRLIEEYDLLANPKRLLARYYYADGDTPVAADLADAAGTLTRYHFLHDHLESVTAVVRDATGSVVERMHYDAWGHSLVEVDLSAPQVAQVIEDVDGSLILVFSEPVLPAAAGTNGLVTAAADLSGLLIATSGGSTVNGQISYLESAPGLPFGTLVRFTASGSPALALTLEVAANQLFDSAGNGNIAQPIFVPLAGTNGVRFTSTVTDTRPQRTPSSSVGNPFRFHGQYAELDLGLIYMRARFYDPLTGTFLERDPFEYADSVNLYAGMANNPVGFRDPMGTNGFKVAAQGGAKLLEEVVETGTTKVAERAASGASRAASVGKAADDLVRALDDQKAIGGVFESAAVRSRAADFGDMTLGGGVHKDFIDLASTAKSTAEKLVRFRRDMGIEVRRVARWSDNSTTRRGRFDPRSPRVVEIADRILGDEATWLKTLGHELEHARWFHQTGGNTPSGLARGFEEIVTEIAGVQFEIAAMGLGRATSKSSTRVLLETGGYRALADDIAGRYGSKHGFTAEQLLARLHMHLP